MTTANDSRIDSVIELLTRLATGDLEARGVRTDSDDELNAVIVGVNMLAEELAAHRSELEHRVRARTVELEAARREATEATRLKSEFLATMSHEIRTPLNGVIGLTDLLLRSELDPSQRKLVTGIAQAGGSLRGLLNDVLDISKIEAGKLELEVIDFEPLTVINQVRAVLAGVALEKDVALVVSSSGEVPRSLRGDPGRFGQVVTNLVSNAVKFTHHGHVVVEVALEAKGSDEAGQSTLRVEVADTGIGIPLAAQAGLFESFTQADPSTTREYGGTGLGLSISRRLVHALGGDIGFTSEEGVGTTFWFTATFEQAAPLAVPPGVAVSGPSPAPSAIRRTVLVAEDNDLNRLVAQGMLEALGYVVEFAHDGEQALAQVAEGSEDFVAVLMDCQMPRMDGYDATRAIRLQEAPGSHLPIIAMTASAMAGEEERCLRAGMDDFVAKPVDFDKLGRVLERWTAPAPAANGRRGVQTDGADVLDLERVIMLEQLRPGNHSLFEQFVKSFDLRAPDNAAAIHAALAERDASRLAQAAHLLKGSAENIGAAAVGRLCAELEEAGRNEDLDSALQAAGRLDEVLSRALHALQDRVA